MTFATLHLLNGFETGCFVERSFLIGQTDMMHDLGFQVIQSTLVVLSAVTRRGLSHRVTAPDVLDRAAFAKPLLKLRLIAQQAGVDEVE